MNFGLAMLRYQAYRDAKKARREAQALLDDVREMREVRAGQMVGTAAPARRALRRHEMLPIKRPPPTALWHTDYPDGWSVVLVGFFACLLLGQFMWALAVLPMVVVYLLPVLRKLALAIVALWLTVVVGVLLWDFLRVLFANNS